jgi:ATP-binding cassette subfamily F protein 3
VLLRASGISKAFGPKEVLRSIDLQVNEGDRIGLVGRNGIGKTTLLRVLMGQIRPDLGEVTIRAQRTCYVPQIPDAEGSLRAVDAVMAAARESAYGSARIAELELILSSGSIPPGVDLNEITKEYVELQNAGAEEDEGPEVRARELLAKLGMSQETQDSLVSKLSGGEVTKVMLARALVCADKADLLFLDEPTNHLDMQTTEWLEEYLLRTEAALMVVSHDRYFLDRVVTQVADLEEGKLRRYSGNYTAFVEKKALDLAKQQKAYDKYQVEKQRQLGIADEQHRRLRFSATHKTRLKMVDRMDAIDRPTERADIKVRIQAAERSGKNVILASGLMVTLGGRPVLRGIDLDIEVKDKLGIFGPNGSGKTTLLRAIVGEVRSEGELWVAPGAVIGYYSQGHDWLDSTLTAEQQLLASLGEGKRAEARAQLARLLITGRDAERPIATLSGGERARVALAQLLAEKRNLLVLDEPTNYLDIEARQAVEDALIDYEGTLIVVTHDRYLLDRVCGMVGEMHSGLLRVFSGNYTQMKGVRQADQMIEEAGVYKVLSGFTEWNSRRKFKQGDRITIAPSEMELFQWALDAGKLKRMSGSEVKKVERRS